MANRSRMARHLGHWFTAFAVASTVLGGTQSAQATFPGSNGRIAYQAIWDIWTVNSDGTDPTNLTNNGVEIRDVEPAWSPTGDKIAFASNRDGNYEIYIMDTEGGGQTRLTMSPGNDQWPTWSPDGQTIAFSRGAWI